MFQEVITTALCSIEIEHDSKWYILALEFIGEYAPKASSNDELTKSDNNDDTLSIHLDAFQVAFKGS